MFASCNSVLFISIFHIVAPYDFTYCIYYIITFYLFSGACSGGWPYFGNRNPAVILNLDSGLSCFQSDSVSPVFVWVNPLSDTAHMSVLPGTRHWYQPAAQPRRCEVTVIILVTLVIPIITRSPGPSCIEAQAPHHHWCGLSTEQSGNSLYLTNTHPGSSYVQTEDISLSPGSLTYWACASSYTYKGVPY